MRSKAIIASGAAALAVAAVAAFGIGYLGGGADVSPVVEQPELQAASNREAVAAAFPQLDAESLTDVQTEALAVLAANEGAYCETSVVLENTTREYAEEVAEATGAKLRITSDGTYAQLTLPEGIDIASVYASQDCVSYVGDMSPDWHASIADAGEEDALATLADDEEADDFLSTGLASTMSFNDTGYRYQDYFRFANLDGAWDGKSHGRYHRESSSAAIYANATVAIIDTGIDTDNSDFSGRISSRSYNATEDKVVADYDNDLSLVEDEQGHGTMVAGVLAASCDNEYGIVGMAPNTEILVIKAECDAQGNFTRSSDLIFGLYYAIEAGAQVANMSFGVQAPSNPFASATRLAVDSDVICVAAAGNDSTSVATWPAADENVIGVGALDDDGDELAFYSNFGDNSDIVAPGTVYTDTHRDECRIANGTSFSAPIVAGAVALFKYSNAGAEFSTVKSLLEASATDLGTAGEDWYFGYGALDIDAFVCGQWGTVTYDMMCDEVADQTTLFYYGHSLQSTPEPEREGLVFDGWYKDDQLTDPFDSAEDTYASDFTVYAGWANEDAADAFDVTEVDGGVEIAHYRGKRRCVSVPDTIDGKTVVGIGESAFEGDSRIVSISLPEGLAYIGRAAFSACTELREIEVPASVTSIGEEAFASCVRLDTARFAEGSLCAEIGARAFEDCSSLSSFEIPSKVNALDGSMFLGDTAMTEIGVASGSSSFAVSDGNLMNASKTTIIYHPAGITGSCVIPSNVTAVGNYAFAYSRCSSVAVSEGVKSFGMGAFMCASFTSVTLPASLEDMGDGCFKQSAVSQVAFSEGSRISAIPDKAFMCCHSLASVLVPASVTTIGEGAFIGSALEEISFEQDSSLKTIGTGAFEGTAISAISLPGSLETIEGEAFADCALLSAIGFADECSLSSIGAKAFEGCCSLVSLVLPAGVSEIGELCFHATGLSSFAVGSSLSSIGAGAFAECSSLASIDVADGNSTYSSVDGVLYKSGGKALCVYPAGKTDASFEMPSEVTAVERYAFYGARNLQSAVLSASMTELSAFSFSHCSGLQSVELPAGLETIGTNAFEYCSQLDNVEIPASVITIGRYAFFCDFGLSDLSFAACSTMKRLGYAALSYTGLQSIVIPQSITGIGQYALAGNTQLASVAFEDDSALTSLSAKVFEGDDALSNIAFGAGSALESIQARALENLASLESIDLSSCTNLTELGNYAFTGDYLLSSVQLPSGLTSIGRYAFCNCASLESVRIPASVSTIDRYAFANAQPTTQVFFLGLELPAQLQDGWDYHIRGYLLGAGDAVSFGDWTYAPLSDGTICALSYTGSDEALDLTSQIDGYSVSSIGYACFMGNTSLKNIVLPSGLGSICDYAFSGCAALSSIEIPSAVTLLGSHAFEGSGIASVTFGTGTSLSALGDYAFASTASLSAFTLPDSVSQIGRYAFYRSAVGAFSVGESSRLATVGKFAFAESGITGIAFPDSITEIGERAFHDASSLESVDLGNPEALSIGEYAFYGTGLTDVAIPAGVRAIGEFAFNYCKSLEKITVDSQNPYYVTDDGALYNAEKTRLVSYPGARKGSVSIPAGVTSIRAGAFEGTMLTSISFESGSEVPSIGYRAFYGCENLESAEIPASVQSVGSYAFAECTSLASVSLGGGSQLSRVGDCAFHNCGLLDSISLPASMQEIGDYAFEGCAQASLTLSADAPLYTIGDGAFAGTRIASFDAPATLVEIGDGAFKGSQLTSLSLDRALGLDSIGSYAFADCSQLATTTLVIPDGVSYLGYGFLSGNTTIENLTLPIPSGLDYDMTIVSVFEVENTSLQSVTISSAYSLPDGLFYHQGYTWESLKRVSLPEGIREVPTNSFWQCWSLEQVNIPEGVTSLGGCAFWHCHSLTSIDLPSSLKSIGYLCFDECQLSSLVLPSQLEVIGQGAFEATAVAGTYETGNPITGIITIPASVKEIGAQAFGGTKIEQFIVEDGNESFCSVDGVIYSKDMKKLIAAPPCLGGDFSVPEGVEVLAPGSFDGVGLDSLTLPESLREIGGYAFAHASIPEVIIPENVEIIGDFRGAFEGTSIESVAFLSNKAIGETLGTMFQHSQIKRVVVPEGVKEIGVSAFNGCTLLEEIILPSTLEIINNNAFNYCLSLKSIAIPESVVSIGDTAFKQCTSLSTLCIPKNVASLGSGFASGCTSLTSLVIEPGNGAYRLSDDGVLYSSSNSKIALGYFGEDYAAVSLEEGVVSVGDYAFLDAKISSVDIPDSCVSIGRDSFYGTPLSSVSGGKNVSHIGMNAFCDTTICNTQYSEIELDMRQDRGIYVGTWLIGIQDYNPTAIEQYHVKEGTTVIATGCGMNCSSLREVFCPDSVLYINDYAFYTSNLKSLHLGSGITEIGNAAFMECDLSELYVPKSLESIEQYAFANNQNLSMIQFETNRVAEFKDESDLFHYMQYVSGPYDVIANLNSYHEYYTDITVVVKTSSIDEHAIQGDCPVLLQSLKNSTIYCCEDPVTCTWASQIDPSNTIYYADDWNHAEFAVDGHVIESAAVRTGQVCTAPTADEVKAAVADPCSFAFIGWDIDGDGKADTLEPTLTKDLHAEAVYTTHDWQETSCVDADCEHTGSRIYTCSACGEERTEEIAALGHDWAAGETIEPTETEDGYTVYTCSRCQETKHDDWKAASSAALSDWTLLKSPTCLASGTEVRYTIIGGQITYHIVDSREVDALGHDYVATVTAPTCTEEGYTTHTCSRCGDSYVDSRTFATGHDWGDWVIDQEATYSSDGSMHHICKACGEREDSTIPQMEWMEVSGIVLSAGGSSADPVTLLVGNQQQIGATVSPSDASDPSLTWESSDPSVAAVDSGGTVTALGAGAATITASASNGVSASIEVVVTELASIADATIYDIPDQAFTGLAIEPAVTVTSGGEALVQGTDYAVAYSDNVEVGTGHATIAGIGRYTGSVTLDFRILRAVSTPSAAQGLVYDGSEQTGVASGEGYAVSGGAAVDAGDYTATATLEEGYMWDDGTTDPKQIAWSIAESQARSGDYEYAVSDGKATITKYVGTAADVEVPAEIGGYPVTAIGDEAFSGSTSLASVTFAEGSQLTSVGISAFYGCSSLESASIPTSVTSIGERAFCGCALLSEIRFDGSAPTIGTDAFSGVTATAHYPHGDATWTEDLRQGYGGDITWVETLITISDAEVADIPDQAFTGLAIEPAVTVTSGEATLVQGTDYEVAYSRNIAVGTATATIAGIGGYTGTVERTFNIVAPQGCAALRGDANGNGVVNIVDAQIALDLSNGVYGASYDSFPYPSAWGDTRVLWLRIAADANADGAIDSLDARAIQVYVHQGEWG